MTTNDEFVSDENKNRKTKILLIGAVIGALTGLGAAYLLIQQVDEEETLQISPGEGVKLGVSIFSFLRQVTQLGG
ncbi:MAG: hypothetical protein KJ638_02180 [Chloroflexi bacterium]|nr:hypothetical protein [Chloroflexota bacterium]